MRMCFSEMKSFFVLGFPFYVCVIGSSHDNPDG